MKTMMEFIDIAFHLYGGYHGPYESVREFIGNDDKCLRLIYHFLDLGRDDTTVLYKKNFNRASHIIVTFLLGIGIETEQKILEGVNVLNSMPDEYLWMLTALLHDYGYFRKELLVSKSLDDLKLEYNLLTDQYLDKSLSCLNGYTNNYAQYCTYSYKTIKNYYEYRRRHVFKGDENGEMNDHGIMGACLAFSQYVRFYLKNETTKTLISNEYVATLQKTEPLLYKTACLLASQHNMFRSESPEKDLEYREYGLTQLLSNTPILIDGRNPLLLMLSLVDTIECSKRFSKRTNRKKYLQTITILEKTSIEVSKEQIVIDYTELHQYMNKKDRIELLSQLDRHIKNISGLGSWTSCDAYEIEPYVVVIQKKS